MNLKLIRLRREGIEAELEEKRLEVKMLEDELAALQKICEHRDCDSDVSYADSVAIGFRKCRDCGLEQTRQSPSPRWKDREK